MRTSRDLLAIAVALIAVTAALTISGCGGGDNAAPPAPAGTVTGRCVDARTSVGLGGVTVAVMRSGLVVAQAVSTTPNGDFAITGVTPGTYSLIRVTPDPVLYGDPRHIALSPAIVVVDGGVPPLSGSILILDDVPPDPV
jgi:hypothetical protein